MSAYTIYPPNKEYAPAAYKKYYDGYDPDLYKDICKEWALCNKKDYKKSTPIKYAKLAQEYFKDELEKTEAANFAGKVFIDKWDARPFIDLTDVDQLQELLGKHIDRLLDHIQNNFKVTNLKDIVIRISYYDRKQNSKRYNYQHVDDLTRYPKEKEWKYRLIIRPIIENSIPKMNNIMYGWSIYTSNDGKMFFIDMEYGPGYNDIVEECNREDIEKWKKEIEDNRRNPWGYGNGAYNGD